jgi:replicative DNA helicase
MSIVPALDLRPANESRAPLPHNLDAEQALLGILLYDNGAFERLPDGFRGEQFYEPFHQRLFALFERHLRKGQLVEPTLIQGELANDPAYEELGGIRYLADLADRAPPSPNARDYARVIQDMALRRDVLAISQDAAKLVVEDMETSGREHAEQLEQQLFALGEHKASGGVMSFGEALTGAVSMTAEAFSRDGGISGIATGLIDLDQKIGGLHNSDLVILAARPSMGKTSLACNIAHYIAKRYAYEQQPDGSRKTTSGGSVLFFSLEMSAEQLALRICAAEAGISGDRLRKGEIDATEFGRFRDAAVELSEIPLYIDATGGLPLAKLAARARRQKRLGGLDLIVVDYLQLVTMGAGYGANNRVQEVSAITQGLKALAKDLDVPVIALSQLSRQVESREDKKPQLSDLRESGSIEQDADMVIFLYREEYYLKRAEPKPGTNEHESWSLELSACQGAAEAIIGKQRHGPIGTVRLSFNEDLTLFGNLARDLFRADRAEVSARNPAGDD